MSAKGVSKYDRQRICYTKNLASEPASEPLNGVIGIEIEWFCMGSGQIVYF